MMYRYYVWPEYSSNHWSAASVETGMDSRRRYRGTKLAEEMTFGCIEMVNWANYVSTLDEVAAATASHPNQDLCLSMLPYREYGFLE
jgi:hypothetical protein